MQARNPDVVAVGDVVIIEAEDKPRTFWKLARIERLIVGQDGQTRAAVVKVGNVDQFKDFTH